MIGGQTLKIEIGKMFDRLGLYATILMDGNHVSTVTLETTGDSDNDMAQLLKMVNKEITKTYEVRIMQDWTTKFGGRGPRRLPKSWYPFD